MGASLPALLLGALGSQRPHSRSFAQPGWHLSLSGPTRGGLPQVPHLGMQQGCENVAVIALQGGHSRSPASVSQSCFRAVSGAPSAGSALESLTLRLCLGRLQILLPGDTGRSLVNCLWQTEALAVAGQLSCPLSGLIILACFHWKLLLGGRGSSLSHDCRPVRT